MKSASGVGAYLYLPAAIPTSCSPSNQRRRRRSGVLAVRSSRLSSRGFNVFILLFIRLVLLRPASKKAALARAGAHRHEQGAN
jgi:hypothetical protein